MLKKLLNLKIGRVALIVGAMTLLVGAGKILYGERLNLGASISFQQGTVDPTATATSAEVGSLYFNTSTGNIYRKTDSGSSVNWVMLGTSAAITAPTSWTPTFANFGTVTGINAKYWQVGNGIAFEATWTAGTVVNATASMTLPSVCTTASDYPTLQVVGVLTRSASNLAASDYVLAESNSGFLYFGLQFASSSGLNKVTGTAYSNNAVLSAKGYVRCAGLASVVNTATTPIITAWTAYTPTFTGWGTVVTQAFKYRQVGSNVEIEGRFTAATATSTEVRVSLPSVCSAAAIDYTTLEQVGSWSTTNSSVPKASVLIEPSVSYVTFSAYVAASTSTLAKRLGTDLASAGNVISLQATVRCAGMPGVIPAPSLVGFATNNGSSAIRIESFKATGTCVVTEIGGSDVVNGNGSNPATGRCVYTINSGLFSAAPVCVCTNVTGTTICSMDDAFPTTTSVGIQMSNSAGALGAYDHSVMCMGPR